MYRIGEFSKMVKLTVKTLRFYDDVGLLKPAYTDEFTGYRYYTMQQLFPVQQIIALRQAGFSIQEIQYVLSGKNLTELLERKHIELTAEKEQANQRLLRLASIKQYYLEEQKMDYHAIVKTIPEQIVYSKELLVKDFSDYQTLIPAIGEEIAACNPTLKCAVPDYCYVEYIDGEYKEHNFHVKYVEAVETFGKETKDIKFQTLPETQVACVMHKGAYENLREAYAYLMKWIDSNDYQIVGNAREQYIDGCWNQTDVSNYLTEVQFPVRKK